MLTGGANDDSFLFNTALNAQLNVDRITDFSAARDTIVLENSLPGTFRGLVNGCLAESAFKANATGTASDACKGWPQFAMPAEQRQVSNTPVAESH